jgi:hypothetical protein
MTNTKLTLSADKNLVRRAKRLAAARKTSLSAMVGRFLRAIVEPDDAAVAVGPLTRKASGMAKLPDRKTAELLADALAAKYQSKK